MIVIENGRLIIGNNASIQTSRVAFALTGDNIKASSIEFPNSKGKAATLSLAPPTGLNNPWRGVSVYQDPTLTFQVNGLRAVVSLSVMARIHLLQVTCTP